VNNRLCRSVNNRGGECVNSASTRSRVALQRVLITSGMLVIAAVAAVLGLCTHGSIAAATSPDAVGSISQLVDDLYNEDPQSRWKIAQAAAEELERIGAPALSELMEAVGSGRGDAWSRSTAVRLLGSIGSPEAISAVLVALEDSDSLARRAAVEALASIGVLNEQVLESLVCSLDDSDSYVRAAAVKALGSLDPGLECVGPAVAVALADQQVSVAWEARKALTRVGLDAASRRIMSALVSGQEDCFAWSDSVVARALLALTDDEDRDMLRQLLLPLLSEAERILTLTRDDELGLDVNEREVLASAVQVGRSALADDASVAQLVFALMTLKETPGSTRDYRAGAVLSRRLSVDIVHCDEAPRHCAAKPPAGYAECPPWLLSLGNTVRFYFTTNNTFSADLIDGKSFLSDIDALDPATARLVTTDTLGRGTARMLLPEEIDPKPYWRHIYYGLFTAHLVDMPAAGEKAVIGIIHGENKNEILNGYRYDNTVKPPQEYSLDQYCGYTPEGGYRDYWPAYFGFIGMAYSPLSEKAGSNLLGHDLGPIVWPSDGYLRDDHEQASAGVRHPSSIVEGGYLYVYYLDESRSSEDGRQQGIKVARAKLDPMAEPGDFYTYYAGEFGESALPENFDRNDRSFFYEKGGRSSKVIPTNAVRFSVAKVKGTPYYLGVEERLELGDMGIYLRASTDLVNWSDGVLVPGTKFDEWISGLYHYPIMVNRDFTSNTEIDADGFYILGPTWGTVHALYLGVDISLD